MEETTQYTRRLQAIAEKRKVQEEIDKKRRELEEERLKLQQLKRKSLRDRWLMEGTGPPDQETDPSSPLGQSQACIEELQEQLESLQSQMNRLENHASESAGPKKAPAQSAVGATELRTVADTADPLPMDTSSGLQNDNSKVSPVPPHGEAIKENGIGLHVNGTLVQAVREEATGQGSGEALQTSLTPPRATPEQNNSDSNSERAGDERTPAVPRHMAGNQDNNPDSAKMENGHDLEEKVENKEERKIQALTTAVEEIGLIKASSEDRKPAEDPDVKEALEGTIRADRFTGAQHENGYVRLVSKGIPFIAAEQTEAELEGVIRAERVMIAEDGEEVLVKSLEGYVPTGIPDIEGLPEPLQRSETNSVRTGIMAEMESTSEEMEKTLKEGFQSTPQENSAARLQGQVESPQSTVLTCHGKIQELQEDAASFPGQTAALPGKIGTFLEGRLSSHGEIQAPHEQGEIGQEQLTSLQGPELQEQILELLEQLPSGQIPDIQETISAVQDQLPSIQCKISTVQEQVPSIKDNITSIHEQIPGLHASIQDQIQGAQASIQDQIQCIQATITEQIPGLQTSIQEQVPGLQASIQDQIQCVQATITEQIPGLQASIQDQIQCVQATIIEQIPGLQGSIHYQIPGLQASIQDQIQGVQASIQDQIPGLQASIQDQIPGLQASIQEQIPGLQASIQEQISSLQASVQEQIPSIQDTISTIQEQMPNIQSHITSVEGQIPHIQEQISTVQDQIPSIQETISTIQEQIPAKDQILSIQNHIPSNELQISGLKASVQGQIPSIQNKITSIQEQIPSLQGSTQEKISGVQEGDTKIKVTGDLGPKSAAEKKVLENLSPEQQPLLQEVDLSDVQAPALQGNFQLSNKSKAEITKPLITKSQESPTYTATSANTAQGSPHRSTESRADGLGPDRPKQKTCQCCSVM